MANEQNLIPYTAEQNREEAKKNGHKGGIASGKARRERKEMKETLELLLSMAIDGNKVTDIEKIKDFKGLKGKNITVQDAIMVAQIQKALKGDRGSAEFIRDSIGEKPKDSTNVSFELPVFFEGEEDLPD